MPPDLPGHDAGDLTNRTGPRKTAAEETTLQTTPASPREWFGKGPEFLAWWEWSRVTGDWGGGRTFLEENGLTIAGSYTLDWQSVWSGGINNVASTRSVLDINASLDLGTAFGLTGGTVFFDFYSSDPRGGSRDVGDYGGVSNIETTDNVDEIAELWYEQWLFDDVARVKVGKIDAQAEFALPRVAESFLGSAPVTNNTLLQTMPTWPNPSTAAVLYLYPTENIYIGAGFFDGSPSDGKNTGRQGPRPLFKGDEYYYVAEAGLTWKKLGDQARLGRVGLGGWHHTGTFARFDGGEENGTNGLYVLGEQQILTRGDQAEDAELDDPSAARGLFFLAHAGIADEAVNTAGFTIGGGLVLRGTFGSRDDDSVALFVCYSDLSDDDSAGFEGDETSIELLYRVQLTPAVTIVPDLQYILSPGGAPGVDDALVGGVRIEVAF